MPLDEEQSLDDADELTQEEDAELDLFWNSAEPKHASVNVDDTEHLT